MIFLDYAANSPVNNSVLQLFNDISINHIANPNSTHKLGQAAKLIIDNATEQISDLLKIDDCEIIYTSGATESNNHAVKGIFDTGKKSGHIITTDLDHPSVLVPIKILQEQGFEIDMVDVLKNGHIDIDHLKSLLRKDTALVSIPYVDSELGIIQPIEKIAQIIEPYPNCIFFSDVSQAVGKINVDFNYIDLASIAPHKFYGLNGIGLLIKKNNIKLNTLIHGGKSTTAYRGGSPATALIASSAMALQLIMDNIESNFLYVSELNQKLRQNMALYKNICINSPHDASPYILNFSASPNFYEILENNDVYVSRKSACCPVNSISKPVYAVTKNKRLAMNSLRLSLSHLTGEHEIEQFLNILKGESIG